MKTQNFSSVGRILRVNPSETAVRIGVVDHEEYSRNVLVSAIATIPGCQCVLASGEGARALAHTRSIKPDVMLVDLELADMPGLGCARELSSFAPPLCLIGIAGAPKQLDLQECLHLRFLGFLSRPVSCGEVADALRVACSGGIYVSPGLVEAFRSERSPGTASKVVHTGAHLTNREREVIDLLRQGMPYKTIADHLDLSVSTVNNHLARIREKLGAHSGIEAILKYF